MFELPEFVTLARQFNQTLQGKSIQRGSLGNSPHKFVWYNRTPDEFAELVRGRLVGQAYARGKWLFVPLEPGYVLLLGECGGKVLYNGPGSKVPAKYHLYLGFQDGSYLTVMTQMWGAMELHEQGQELGRQYIKGMSPTPIDPEFNYQYFSILVDGTIAEGKRSVKGLLTQDQLIPGLGNAIAQDIMFRARACHKQEWCVGLGCLANVWSTDPDVAGLFVSHRLDCGSGRHQFVRTLSSILKQT